MTNRRASSVMGMVAAGLLTAGLVAACTSPAPPEPGPSPSASDPHEGHDMTPSPSPTAPRSPLAGVELYVDPESNAAEAYAQLVASNPEQAKQIEPLAATPTAIWFGGEENPYERVDRVTRAASDAGQVPVLVVYTIPNRDCGLYSSGGAADIDTYLNWVGSFTAGINGRDAIVILEPDAVAHSIEGCEAAGNEIRYAALSEAVKILKRSHGVRLYIDAGNASWIEDLDALAAGLHAAGIKWADGFALNVSNFETTERSVQYGQQLSAKVEGKGFVIDTSRNGGAVPEPTDDHTSWCNPPGVRIGQKPTTDPGFAGVDALLWVKHPGDSDGDCVPGAPPAGEWWPDYARELTAS